MKEGQKWVSGRGAVEEGHEWEWNCGRGMRD